MSVLTLFYNGQRRDISFTPPLPLHEILGAAGIPTDHPCGGKGRCGKCAVKLEGSTCPPTSAEIAAGTRLSCQAVLTGDATAWIGHTSLTQIEANTHSFTSISPMMGAYGAAVDIGTTTVALSLCRLSDGAVLSSAAAENPQRSIAADVIGRMEAAMAGKLPLLQQLVTQCVQALLKSACEDAGIEESAVESLVITGNTTMLYLLTGKNPEPLSHAPFQADCLFGYETTILDKTAYLPPCMDAFVGADITCAVLSSAMTDRSQPALLCDIGTNGEIALWKDGTLSVTSTAAGPAFEGAGISCGCGSIPGAIDKVWLEDQQVRCHTIGNIPAVGLCGSGLIDAISVFLRTQDIDETGAAENDLLLAENVTLVSRDIRAVQLAKAAIAAGIQTLLETTDTEEDQLSDFYICGGFGTHLNLESAAGIGLFPRSFAQKARVLGNAALSGATALLLDTGLRSKAQQLAKASCQLNLGGNPKFNENYIEQILFPQEGM